MSIKLTDEEIEKLMGGYNHDAYMKVYGAVIKELDNLKLTYRQRNKILDMLYKYVVFNALERGG